MALLTPYGLTKRCDVISSHAVRPNGAQSVGVSVQPFKSQFKSQFKFPATPGLAQARSIEREFVDLSQEPWDPPDYPSLKAGCAVSVQSGCAAVISKPLSDVSNFPWQLQLAAEARSTRRCIRGCQPLLRPRRRFYGGPPGIRLRHRRRTRPPGIPGPIAANFGRGSRSITRVSRHLGKLVMLEIITEIFIPGGARHQTRNTSVIAYCGHSLLRVALSSSRSLTGELTILERLNISSRQGGRESHSQLLLMLGMALGAGVVAYVAAATVWSLRTHHSEIVTRVNITSKLPPSLTKSPTSPTKVKQGCRPKDTQRLTAVAEACFASPRVGHELPGRARQTPRPQAKSFQHPRSWRSAPSLRPRS